MISLETSSQKRTSVTDSTSILSYADTVIELTRDSESMRDVDDESTDISFEDEDDMDARKSLTDLAQFMLPALIEKGGEKVEKEERLDDKRNRRFGGNQLMRSAHSHILWSAAGMKDIAGRAHLAGKRHVERLQEKPPLFFVILRKTYHDYGLKHLVLILVFLIYCAIGAAFFLLIEGPHQNDLKEDWAYRMFSNRTVRVTSLMKRVFNNSDYLIYIKGGTTEKLKLLFMEEFSSHERQLGIKWSEQRMELDFWNALLFAGTICTTIGYGHIYPITNIGKIFTMVFAMFGIPLMLLVLQDIGKLLTWTMKYPWFQTKRLVRRILRCCTKQPLREMREIEECERADLEVFDLPVIVGVSLIGIWVFICSTVLSMFDQKWTLLESFYFFFISLSTVGLGDLVPSSPRLLLAMFSLILIGLSLVSMVINLLQGKMKRTYEAGRVAAMARDQTTTTLGIIQCFEDEEKKSSPERSLSRSTQTSLSLPGVKQVVLRSDGVHWVTGDSPCKSPDEVTRLVEMESSLRVCEQIGDNNNDEQNDDNLVDETDVLLEVGEDYNYKD